MSFSANPNFGRAVHDPGNPLGLFQAMVQFLRHMRARGNTDQTVFGYERYIRDFIAWCDVRDVHTPEDVDSVILEQYLGFVQSLKVASTGLPLSWLSKESKLVPVRSFFRWLKKSKRLCIDPAEDLRLVRRTPRTPVRPLSLDEIGLLLEHPDIRKPTGVRDRAMLEVLFATGIRRMELAQLRIDDIDFRSALLTVRNGKGGKRRSVPITRSALDWISKHLEVADKLPNSMGILFPTRKGTPFNLSWLSTTIGDHVHRATGRRVGACHLLRHSMANRPSQTGRSPLLLAAVSESDELVELLLCAGAKPLESENGSVLDVDQIPTEKNTAGSYRLRYGSGPDAYLTEVVCPA